MKILGIDFGTKKVGLAFADMNIRIAMPGDIIYYSQKKELIEKIKKIIHERSGRSSYWFAVVIKL